MRSRKIFLISLLALLTLMFSVGTGAATPALAEKPAQAEAACESDVVVQLGDWLAKLADKFYGDPQAYTVIFDATNAAAATDSSYATIANPNLIQVGWKLCIPSAESAQAMMGGEMASTQDETQATTTMTAGNGETYTLTMQTLPNSRNFQYCELVFNYSGDHGSDIYSTSPLAPCDLDWWDNLDLDALAQEFGAESVTKNGPEWWSMDEVGVLASEPVSVAGVDMVFGANLPPGTIGAPQYTVFSPAKTQNLTWNAGQPVYELVDADGNVYIMQGYKVDQGQLSTLGAQFQELPEGWSYIVVDPSSDLVMNLTPDAPIPSVQDEFDQIYIQIQQPPETMTSAAGEDILISLKLLPDSRDYIYCELVFDYGDAGQDIYSTSPLAPCDTDWWDNLDLDEVAAELGANSVVKNGPQWWSMDEVGVMASEPVTIAGVDMNFGAVLPAGTTGEGGTPHYQVFNTSKNQYLLWEAGKPIYQLVDPDGNVYVLQGNKIPTDQLATLGSQFQDLPEGWQYIVVTPSAPLALALTPNQPIPSVQDEFDQIYIRIPAPTYTMTSAAGEDVAITLKLLPDSRDYIYCELVFDYGDAGQDIYSTSPLAPCDTDWWDNLDLDEVAAELGANSVVKNGPQWWSMDEVGVLAGEPVTIAGVDMNFGAVLPPGTTGEGGTPHYQVFNTSKNQFLLWEAGQPTYRLVDPDGNVYILQGNKIPSDQLDTLGSQFQNLPEGWQYQVVDLAEPLALSLTPNAPIPSVQDEFDQIYIRITE